MKKFAKLFMAVAALVVGVACTTDATEDLGVNPVGQTTLTLSLEESRTQLGAKADGVYSLVWSEGDAIAVNGVTSTALTAEQAGAAGALFTFESTLTRPYSIIYPAPAEGVAAVTEGTYPVTFPALQTYSAGTFASGAAPMYGYAAADTEGAIQMNHLTGVLGFAVKGNASLQSLVISTESGAPLAGTFDINCTTGALTAQEGNTSATVTLSFGDGLALKADEATPIYVAVPAGNYGTVQATLHTVAGEKMTVKFDSESKPIAAGTVREFAEFSFVANTNDEASVFEIYDVATLLQFAKIAPTFYPRTEAKVTAAIDMTGVEWNPVEGFGAYTFDGGNFEINGLSAPLFGTTDALIIKNVKLTNVNIVENTNFTIGALARMMTNNDATVENCSAVGKITITSTSEATEGDNSTTNWAGGLIGRSSTKNYFDGLSTDVDIYVEGIIPTKFAMGGCVSSTDGAIKNSTNLGTLTFKGSSPDACTIYAGGVCFECDGMENCTNGSAEDTTGALGAIEIGGVVGGAGAMGGLADMTKGNVTNCHNYGNLTASSTEYNNNSLFIGGVVRMSNDHTSIYTDCSNHGDILVKGCTDGKSYLKCGGIVSKDNYGCTFNNCDNYGDFTIDSEVSMKSACYGGLSSTIEFNNTKDTYKFEFNNCDNYGNIDINGTYSVHAIIGGLIASVDNLSKLTCTTCTNSGEVKFGATITAVYDSNGKIVDGWVRMGGLVGFVSYAETPPVFEDCTNNGAVKITKDAKVVNESDIGGILGILGGKSADKMGKITLRNCSNLEGGDVEIACTSAVKFNIGGIVGRLINTFSSINLYEEIVNRGDLKMSGNVKEFGMGGIFGFFLNQFGYVSKTGYNMINYGKLTFSGTTSGGRCLMGGLFGATDANMNSGGGLNPINLGDIVCTGTIDTSKANYIGGIVGLMATTAGKVHNCQSFCNIEAIGFPNVGIVAGLPRSSNNYTTNCKAGGTICKSLRIEEADDGSGDEVAVKEVITIDSSNYFEHTYGATLTKDVVDGDNFTLLTSAEEIVYRTLAATE